MFKLCVLIGLLFVLEACLARPGSAPENGRRRPAPRRGPPPPPPPRRGPPPPPRRRPPPRRAPPPPPPPPPPPAYYYGTEPPMAQPYYEGSCSCNRGVEYCQPGEYKQGECEDGVVCCGGD